MQPRGLAIYALPMAEFSVSRQIAIGASPAAIHALIDDCRAWLAWSPWEDLDPLLARSYTGAEAGVGAQYAWTGNRKAGDGSMEIVASTPEKIVVTVRFLKPFKATNTATFELHDDGGSTVVTWTMAGNSTGLAGFFSRFMSMDKMIGPDFEKGLARLKVRAEQGG